MADPLSLTGTAVGILSLGIQVSSGIMNYYSEWKDQDSDIQTTYQMIEQLSSTLSLLSSKLQSESLSQCDTAGHVLSSIELCEGGILKLQARLVKIKAREPDPRAKMAELALGKLQAQGERLLYPFKQGMLGKLQDSVSELRHNLGSALQVLDL
jgi:hypothetical protein